MTEGQLLRVPDAWAFLPPGDAALSRRIKADGPSWTVIEFRGGKRFSRGIWAPEGRIEFVRAQLAVERNEPSYSRRLEAGRRRRAAEQAEYAEDFEKAVFDYLAFHSRYAEIATTLAKCISAHAVRVGSGTVARTRRIPVEERAEAAVIAWMRHQTTGYDGMLIARIKGERREVAENSRQGRDSFWIGIGRVIRLNFGTVLWPRRSGGWVRHCLKRNPLERRAMESRQLASFRDRNCQIHHLTR